VEAGSSCVRKYCLRFICARELGGGTCKVSGCSECRRLILPSHFVVGTRLAYCDRSTDDGLGRESGWSGWTLARHARAAVLDIIMISVL